MSDSLGLPPLVGGHEEGPPPTPPRELFAAEEPTLSPKHRARPSKRRRVSSDQQQQPPPDKSNWEKIAEPWCSAAFLKHHALLQPIFQSYIARRTSCESAYDLLPVPRGLLSPALMKLSRLAGVAAGTCKTIGSFLHAFYLKEGMRARKAVAAAAEYLLMEGWRDGWLAAEPEGVLPTERRERRSLMDPLLVEASKLVSEQGRGSGGGSGHLHRESVEFSQAVVKLASRLLRQRRASSSAAAAPAGSDTAGSDGLT